MVFRVYLWMCLESDLCVSIVNTEIIIVRLYVYKFFDFL